MRDREKKTKQNKRKSISFQIFFELYDSDNFETFIFLCCLHFRLEFIDLFHCFKGRIFEPKWKNKKKAFYFFFSNLEHTKKERI